MRRMVLDNEIIVEICRLVISHHRHFHDTSPSRRGKFSVSFTEALIKSMYINEKRVVIFQGMLNCKSHQMKTAETRYLPQITSLVISQRLQSVDHRTSHTNNRDCAVSMKGFLQPKPSPSLLICPGNVVAIVLSLYRTTRYNDAH